MSAKHAQEFCSDIIEATKEAMSEKKGAAKQETAAPVTKKVSKKKGAK